ncbi:MAG: isocitrate/isopropylmalate family dehydrogenase [Chloroflexota bacterium]|nr:isocitrate/isopropylmalate family dehydrogenase [Chloroflexota bacterium]
MDAASRAVRLGVLGGDGIGPEVVDAALMVLDAAEARFGFKTERVRLDWSGEQYLRDGRRFDAAALEPIKKLDAVLLGAIGHPDVPRGMLEADIIFGLRIGLDLYVNLRPLVLYDARLCPLKGKTEQDIRIVVMRENTEDVYGRQGQHTGEGTAEERVSVEMIFTRHGIERIVRYAFERAHERPRKHVTLVDKSNAIPVQAIWRTIFEEVGTEFPDVERHAMYVDAACMWLVQRPERFSVIVTTNLFGDIITDLGAAICGGLGIGASGNIHPGRVSMFEPLHGSAPKYGGQRAASPIGAIGALALLLDHVGLTPARDAIDAAIFSAFRTGRIEGVEARPGRTFEDAKMLADLVADPSTGAE